MLEVLNAARNTWKDTPTMVAYPNDVQFRDMSIGIAESMWKHRKESVIVDRNREWANNITMAKEIFGETKVLITTRDLPSIMASWKRIYLRVCDEQEAYKKTNQMWDIFVKKTADDIRALKQQTKRFMVVRYDDLIIQPSFTLQKIETFFGIPEHEYDFNNIRGDYQDKNINGIGPEGLHRVKPVLEKEKASPKEVLGEALYNKFSDIQKDYSDIF